MNVWLAYNILIGICLLIVFAIVFDIKRMLNRIFRLAELHDDPPTEEIPLPPTMRIGPIEDFGPGKPLPPEYRGWLRD